MKNNVDYPLLILTVILLGAGVLIVSSASIAISEKNFGNVYGYALRHALYAAVGLIALFAGARVPYKTWAKLSLFIMVGVLFLLGVVLFPQIGFTYGGATRWIHLGFLSFQPSELLKLGLVLYLATWLARRRETTTDTYRGFIPFIVILAVISVLLIQQPDVGTLGVVAFTAVALYFLGGGKINQLVMLGLLGAVALSTLIWLEPYRAERLTVFLHPNQDPQGIGYHLNQAFIAIGSGGFWGRGFGQSLQKYNYLPESSSDSVFAVFVEEFGFVGALVLVILFLLFLWRGIYIARRAPDLFSRLVASGIAVSIGYQAFENMGAISGVLPLTGVPLPFISYGGTALVITLFSVGIVLNISRKI